MISSPPVLVMEYGLYGIWTADDKGRLEYVSPSFQELLGMPLEACLKKYFELLEPEDRGLLERAWQNALESDGVLDCNFRIRGKDRQYHHVLCRGWPVHGTTGATEGWTGIHLDISDRKAKEEILLQMLELVGANNSAHDFPWFLEALSDLAAHLLDADGFYIEKSEEESVPPDIFKSGFDVVLVDKTPADTHVYVNEQLFTDDKYRSVIAIPVAASPTGRLRVCFPFSTPRRFRSTQIQLATMLSRVMNGTSTLIAAMEEERRKRKAADEAAQRDQMLLTEAHHRIKNNLQLVTSLLWIQSRTIKDAAAAEALSNVANRIHVMAKVHDLLSVSAKGSTLTAEKYFSQLAQDLIQLLSPQGQIHAEVLADESVLPPDSLVYLGLLLTELITNSVKHGFRNKAEGRIVICFKRENEGYTLSYSDNGCGMPEVVSQQETMGMRLLELLTSQCQGNVRFVHQEAGTGYIFTFPLQLK